MNNLKTLLTAALMSVALGSVAFAEEKMSDIWLESPAHISHVFAYYKQNAPAASFEKFLSDNPQLGEVKLEDSKPLPAGTVFYSPTYPRS
jgi:hypothetical protein